MFFGDEIMYSNRFTIKLALICALLILTSNVSVKTGMSASAPSAIRLSWTQDATDTTITIMWETSSSGNRNEVQYGNTEACEIDTVTGFCFPDPWNVNYNHQVNLTGLTPDTKYFYKVSGDAADEWSAVHTFTTAPDTSINWTFFVVPDSQSIDGFDSVINAMRAFPEGRMVFAAGDILGNFDSQTDWCQWTDARYRACRGRW